MKYDMKMLNRCRRLKFINYWIAIKIDQILLNSPIYHLYKLFFTYFTLEMHSFQEKDIPKLSLVKSANFLKLDLNYKMQKKSQIKLLNAKIRNLKNKCKALRQESKTDRQILSNLMNTTSELQSKTNSGIKACKQVSTQLSDNHGEMMSFSVNQNLNQMTQSAEQLALESNCNDERGMEAKKQLSSMEQILQLLPFQKNSEYKNAIYNVPTDRSMTASMKSQGRQQNDVSLDGYMFSGNSQEESEQSESIRRANTISYSPSKIGKVQRRHSLQQNLPMKINRKVVKTDNMFTPYIYAVICTALLTIIFFKVIL